MATRWIVNRKLLFKGNRRFPSYLSPLFQSKSKCEAFYMWTSSIHTQILVHLHVNKTDFHIKDFAQGLALKQRRKATWNLLLHSHWLLWRRRLTLEKSAVIQFKRRLPVLRWEKTVFKWALLQSCEACKPCDVTLRITFDVKVPMPYTLLVVKKKKIELVKALWFFFFFLIFQFSIRGKKFDSFAL